MIQVRLATKQDLEAVLLTKMNVDFIQGYYYSRPLEDKKLIEMLNSLSK